MFSNRILGPAAELAIAPSVAARMLLATADEAAARAGNRWERELVAWLRQAASGPERIDVGDLAWSPEHFEHQRRFLLEAIAGAAERAAERGEDARALGRWAALIEAHPRACVQIPRRWLIGTSTG